MLDIKRIRQHPEEIVEKLRVRGVEGHIIENFLMLDEKRREILIKTENLKKDRNEKSEEIAQLKQSKQSTEEKEKQVRVLGVEIKSLDQNLKEIENQINEIAHSLPNLAHESVPIGDDEEDNIENRRVGELPSFQFTVKPHWEVAEKIGILDFERGAKVTGSRFLFYKGLGARLERAVYNFMLDVHTQQHGYTEMIPPYLVNSQSMFGTGQYPKFKEDVFRVADSDYTLIPTAEVPLTNYYSNEILSADELPIYVTGLSPSFRSEAGSAGKDTRGLIRLHQFHKVEMVKFSDSKTSYDELEKMVNNAEHILQLLELPYRVITLCTGDMGFSAAKTYDLEVWFPQQNKYREISSCSNCEDFQARRAMIRYRDENNEVQYMHTLNGSGLAVGRTVAAILENNQMEDGSVRVPKVLIPYMNGIELIK